MHALPLQIVFIHPVRARHALPYGLNSNETHQNTSCHCRADNTGNVWCHSVHEEVVRWVVFLTFNLGDTGCVRHCRHTGVTDERVDLVAIFAEDVHQLGTANATECRDSE